MPLDLSETLVVGITATALFDLSAADGVFREKFDQDRLTAVAEYRAYMLKHEDEPLADGAGMPLVKALLDLNNHSTDSAKPLVEVVVMSRNSPETGVRVFNNIRSSGLAISRHAFTGGESVVPYLDAFDVDLFLTTNVKDAQRVVDEGNDCATAILNPMPPDAPAVRPGQVRIAFDGDAVLFDESSEVTYKTKGLSEFHRSEDQYQNTPLKHGPYASFLNKLSKLQRRLPVSEEFSPVHIAIVTARNAPAEMRVIKTLRAWGVYVNEIFFLGGLDKTKVLKAFRPHIFFDDQDLHVQPAAKHVPAGKVPYRSDSPLNIVTLGGRAHDIATAAIVTEANK